MKVRLWILAVLLFLLASAVYLGCREREISVMDLIGEKPVFVIDPGHGGEDGGAVGADGVRESEINLAVSLRTGLSAGSRYGQEAQTSRSPAQSAADGNHIPWGVDQYSSE